ncbi:hypothetical protein ES319_A13G132500v1 [Gossypium barbadense]|uniref:Kinesin motor domain-containing protein n=1 Tax=Gossypium barbadense TaxID=3634 RepID=A0A5J5T220_GOSBA|nr:hypothetical protein ES319_A13G132500v1 [Gossypium barbadense]
MKNFSYYVNGFHSFKTEHRHVGSTNFNLLSIRSHTIFTLTIESSSCGENSEGEAVNLSELNLIDLAGSDSSKAETTGIRRKEGSYTNKSLLTLGTIILSQEKNIQRLQELVVIASFSYLACLIASSTQT